MVGNFLELFPSSTVWEPQVSVETWRFWKVEFQRWYTENYTVARLHLLNHYNTIIIIPYTAYGTFSVSVSKWVFVIEWRLSLVKTAFTVAGQLEVSLRCANVTFTTCWPTVVILLYSIAWGYCYSCMNVKPGLV